MGLLDGASLSNPHLSNARCDAIEILWCPVVDLLSEYVPVSFGRDTAIRKRSWSRVPRARSLCAESATKWTSRAY